MPNVTTPPPDVGSMSTRELAEMAINNALPNIDDLPERAEYDITQSQLESELAAIAASASEIRPVVRGQPSAVSVSESVTAMDAVSASQTARDAIGTSGVGYDAVASVAMAIGKYAAGIAGLTPTNYADIDAVASDANAMDAVSTSSTAMDAVSTSSTAMDAVSTSSTAMDAVSTSSTAMDAVSTSSTAMDAVSASSTAMDAVSTSSTAMESVFGSGTALSIIADTPAASESVMGYPMTEFESQDRFDTISTTLENSSMNKVEFTDDGSDNSFDHTGENIVLIDSVNQPYRLTIEPQYSGGFESIDGEAVSAPHIYFGGYTSYHDDARGGDRIEGREFTP